jgi:hypothetical protein
MSSKKIPLQEQGFRGPRKPQKSRVWKVVGSVGTSPENGSDKENLSTFSALTRNKRMKIFKTTQKLVTPREMGPCRLGSYLIR